MIVLGQKYVFSDFEIEKLKRKFKNIDIVKYKDCQSREVRKDIEDLLKQKSYQFLVINTSVFVDPKMIKYLTLLQFRINKKQIKIITIEKFLEKFLKKCYIPDNDSDLNFLGDIKPYNWFQYAIKRFIDYVGAAILAVVHFFIKFYVKKQILEQSPGSLYFLQSRIGLNTRKFKCYKFRTMHENSYHNPYTQKNDERVFKFGHFMRKTRIDEIPQYKNILNKEMHLVGPRAEWNILVKDYETKIPYYNERHIVRPGITGWAQVNYPYGANAYDAKQKLMYDLYYIKYWSLWLEIKIIFKTFWVIFSKKGI
ncbi:MAG: sugar transferase [Campylobacter sp.]